MKLAKTYPTSFGYVALLFWALGALFTIQIKSLPLFQSLTIVFTISFFISAIKLTYENSWSELKQPWFLWVIGFMGIYCNDVLYLAAFKRAPAAHADLINYLWPVLVILCSGAMRYEKLSAKHFFAVLVGFSGIYILLMYGDNGFEFKYLTGYMFALLNAFVWTVYTIAARHYKKTPIEFIGIYCGFAALCSCIAHIHLETFVMPHTNQWAILLIMGITTQGLAYYFWDFSVKKGDFKTLTVISYASPALSILLLVVFGQIKPSVKLFIACTLVSASGFIAIIKWQDFFKLITINRYERTARLEL